MLEWLKSSGIGGLLGGIVVLTSNYRHLLVPVSAGALKMLPRVRSVHDENHSVL